MIDKRKIMLTHPEMVGQMEHWLERRGASWRQLAANEVPGLTKPPGIRCEGQTEALQILIIKNDPVIFAETQFVERPESRRDSDRWRLFDYQKPSLRTRANFIYRCGAGVGKTRQIVILVIWGLIFRKGKIVVVGNQEQTVLEILYEIEFLLDRNPILKQFIPPGSIKKKPRPRIVALSGNVAEFLPTGSHGEPLRGHHAANLLLCDEVAVWYQAMIWRELWRVQEPGCETRLFSVPNGRTDQEFYRLCQAAVAFDEKASDDIDSTQFYRVNWRKPDMPAPWWTPEVEKKLINQYGGEDTPGYLQNVMGDDGDPERAIFPKSHLDACLSSTTPYTLITLVVDPKKKLVRTCAYANNPSHLAGDGEDSLLKLDDTLENAPSALVCEDSWEDSQSFNALSYLEQHLGLRPGTKVIGGDYGYATDPSELLVFDLDDAGVLSLEARIHLRRVTIDDQEAIVRWLLEELEPDRGMGGDGHGYGQSIDQSLPHSLRRQYSPIDFGAKEELLNTETLKPLKDDQGKLRKATAKEISVQLLERRVQRRTLRLPHDAAVVSQFSNYTARRTHSGRTFNPTHRADHVVDASQAAVMRLYRVSRGQIEPPPISSITTVNRRSPLVEPAFDLADWSMPSAKSAPVQGVTVVARRTGSGGLIL